MNDAIQAWRTMFWTPEAFMSNRPTSNREWPPVGIASQMVNANTTNVTASENRRDHSSGRRGIRHSSSAPIDGRKIMRLRSHVNSTLGSEKLK
ncbi:MAG: hypothetical protein ABFC54_02685 [Thermoguttaceae bacterium]